MIVFPGMGVSNAKVILFILKILFILLKHLDSFQRG